MPEAVYTIQEESLEDAHPRKSSGLVRHFVISHAGHHVGSVEMHGDEAYRMKFSGKTYALLSEAPRRMGKWQFEIMQAGSRGRIGEWASKERGLLDLFRGAKSEVAVHGHTYDYAPSGLAGCLVDVHAKGHHGLIAQARGFSAAEMAVSLATEVPAEDHAPLLLTLFMQSILSKDQLVEIAGIRPS